MEKETAAKKNLLWLWVTIGVVVLAVGVSAIFLFGNKGGQEQAAPATETLPELYWNIDRAQMIEEETGMSMREPAEDGKYYIRLSVGGKVVELPCADKKLVNRIDQKDLVCLKLDENNVIVDLIDHEDIYMKLADKVYVQNMTGNKLLVNTSQALNGMQIELEVPAAEGFDISHLAKTPAELRTLESMDQITVYGTDENTATHVFVTDRWWESEVYWRMSAAMYNEKGESTRKKAEDGYWYMDWVVNGEIVTLRTNRQDVINAWEWYDQNAAYCGQVFDENGDVIDCFSAAMAARGTIKMALWDITELSEDGLTFTAERFLVGEEQGKSGTITLPADCPIYNVSSTANVFGEKDTLQMHDRVHVFCDAMGTPKLVFIRNRMSGSPMYYNLDRQWSQEEEKSLRKPDADGWYRFRLLVQNEVVTYRTQDVELVHKLDSYKRNMFGLKLDGDIMVKAYDPTCVVGNYNWATEFYIDNVTGPVVTATLDGYYQSATMAEGCEIYDVSGYDPKATTLRIGDFFTAYQNRYGEITHIYIKERG